MFGLLIEHMLKKMHMAVLVNRRQVEEIKRSLPKNPVIYLPSHRSYADFIIFSYLCFYLDLEVPTVAAGIGMLMRMAISIRASNTNLN